MIVPPLTLADELGLLTGLSICTLMYAQMA